MSDLVVDGEVYRRTKSGGWWEVEHQPGEWYPVPNPELLNEIERLRAIVRDFAKESTYSDALISNLLDPEGSDQ